MPLQLRRGTTAERLSIVPLPGEPIYDTDLDTIFIGNGITAGGISAITGITSEDAQDIVGQMFTNGQHDGLIFTYGSTQDAAGRIDVRLDLSSYDGEFAASAFRGSLYANDSTLLVNADTGVINASAISGTFGGPVAASQMTTAILNADNIFGILTGDMIGSVFSDSSTLLVNGIDASINLDGTVKGDIIPAGNELYDLGSISNRFKDLYLSGSSIFLGNATITSTGSAVNLPAGSTINGTPIGTGTGTGDGVVAGSNYNINIIGDDSSVIVNSSNNTISGNIFTNLVDTLDSSSITFIPAVSMNSDLIVENDLVVSNSVTANLFTGTLTGNIFTDSISSDSGSDLALTCANGNVRFLTPFGGALFGSAQDNTTGNIFINRTGFSGSTVAGLTLSTHHGIAPDMDGFNFVRSTGDSTTPLSIRQFDVIGKINYEAFDGTVVKSSLRHYVAADIIDSNTVASNFVLESLDLNGVMTRRFRILYDGRVTIGPAATTDNASGTVGLEIYNTQYVANKNDPGKPLHIRQYFDGQPANGMNTVRFRGTRAVPTAIQAGDQLFEITAMGFHNSAARLSSRINFLSDETLLPSAIPGIISFDVMGSTGTFIRAVQIRPDGRLYADYGIKGDVVGSVFADDSSMIIDATEGGKITTPSITISDFLQLPVFSNDSARSAAIPTPAIGMVIFIQTGSVPVASNQIQVFDGANWVNV